MNNLISKKIVQVASHYGPGGRKCNCCGPMPKNRKKHDRSIKRRMKNEWVKENKEFLADMWAEHKGNCKTDGLRAGRFETFVTNRFELFEGYDEI